MSDTAPHTFQAEVRQLLDIVINSLYTDREIFLRELVSNASDALEKLRLVQHTHREVFDEALEPEINITTDDTAKTLTITDYGIGMTRDELVQNLGTIAHSGTKAFLQSLEAGTAAAGNVIGKFGVGFYSVFMVAKNVRVYTHSWQPDAEHLCWSSDGRSGYTIEESPGQRRGCRIIIELKDEYEEYSRKWRVSELLKKYSSFVPFPILLSGERVNKIGALWLKNRNEISEDEYKEFYKFIGHAWDEPRLRLHFTADVPLDIHALLFVPKDNPEPWGMGQTDPGVALYCRRVLIDAHPRGLLPDWLRFLRGVIDSDDLPLNISRETMQDSALVQKLSDVITKRFMKFLDAEAKESAEKFADFYRQFSRFLKEGVITDTKHRESLAKLLRFESSMTESGALTGFDECIARMKDGQAGLYFLTGSSRESIESGPYLEAFKARGLEVIYLTEPVDEYLAGALTEVEGKKLLAADSAGLELGEAPPPENKDGLSGSEAEEFCEWLAGTLGDGIEKVSVSRRLVDSPVVALVPDEVRMGPQMRALMKSLGKDAPEPKAQLEINPNHPLITRLARERNARPDAAKVVAAQLLDTALLSAGLIEDPRRVASRFHKVLEMALK